MIAGRERQLTLDLPQRPAFGRDDFLVSGSNAEAVAFIDRWPSWLVDTLILAGPAGSGKSHLAEVWRQLAKAETIAASMLSETSVPSLLSAGALVIEDAPGGALDERALFHLLNLAREQKSHLLIASRETPLAWGVRLPDLLSRLKTIPVAMLGPPDDALLRGVLVKLFADRQIVIGETVISYLMARMPRALAAARLLVDEIDRRALEEKAEITRTFVARLMGGFTEPGLFGDEEP